MANTQLRRILYVTHRVPYPPDKGDRIRTYHTLRILSRENQVSLACLADEPVPEETRQVLESFCHNVAIVPVTSNLRKLRMAWSILTGKSASLSAFQSSRLSSTLVSWAKDSSFDLCLASASSVAPYLEIPELRKTPALIDLVDVDSEKWFNYCESASFPKRWVYRREGIALRRYEKELSRWAQAILLVSEAEAALFRNIAPGANVQAISNGVDLDYFQPLSPPAQGKVCVFVGALDYFPNIDAVAWFTREIWPLIHQKHPTSRFLIVGRRPTPAVAALAETAGVEVVGQVPDVRPCVQQADLVVAPLRIARGLQNKVLEAMAMSRPVVASPAALAGLNPRIPNPVVSASTPADWITAIEKLFINSEQREALAKQGRDYVETHYHWNRCLAPLQDMIESICSTSSKASLRENRVPQHVAVKPPLREPIEECRL